MAEIELKLEALPDDIDAIAASALFGEPEAAIEQHSLYFDTHDRRLFDSGFTLRIRQSGETRMQTVKAAGPSASLFARSEWETPVTADIPVLDHTSPLLNQFGSRLDTLAPQFEVFIERRLWQLTENTSRIEAVIDRGRIVAGGRQMPVCEMELELKDGRAEDLFSLARKIEAIVPIRFGVQSKAERGYRLCEPLATAIKAEPIDLTPRLSSVAGFKTIAESCFRQFRLNEAILLQRRNPEALHQARVGLRRLRSAFSLFKPFLLDDARRLSDEFRWLAGVLGEARNLDVLLPRAKDAEVRQKLEEARVAAYDDVMKALGSARVRALMLDFNEWLQCGIHVEEPENERSLEVFAVDALNRMRKKLKKHGNDLAGVDDEQRHKVRKDAKKLRYGAEFFRSLFADKRGIRRHKRFIKAMESLQDELGALNDLATGPSVLERYGLAGRPDAGSVLSHAKKVSLIEAAQAALDDVLDAKRFWR